MIRPSTVEDWYNLRDDRTSKSSSIDLGLFKEFRVGIKVNSSVEYSFSEQIMTALTLNMLSRWCRDIIVEMPHVMSILRTSNKTDLPNWLIEMMRANDPYGNFRLKKISRYEVDIVLNIGIPSDHAGNYPLWIDSFGWVSGIGNGIFPVIHKTNEEYNFIGPSFAACLGVSELLHHCLKLSTKSNFAKWYSVYDKQSSDGIPNLLKNPIFPRVINVGNIHLIGNGAVGSSLIYLLGLSEWSGKMNLIDFDKIEVPNCASSLLFTAEDAYNEISKVNCGIKYLKGSEFDCFGTIDDYSSFLEKDYPEKIDPDIILCLANEHNIWNTIQTKYPPIVIHGTTTNSWGINVGRHIPLKEWCIMCRFEQNMRVQFKPICGTSEITIDKFQEPVLGNLPFLSPASSVILFSELSKIAVNNIDDQNFVEFSFKPSAGGSFISRTALPRKDCKGCGSQYQHVYRMLQTESKYWNFSENA